MTDASRTQEVSTLWIGGPLGFIEQLCLASFTRAGFTVNLYSYQPDIKPPRGVAVLDATKILPQEAVFENKRRPGTFSGFSNIFRYRLLQKRETVWIDTDCLATGKPLPDSPFLFGYESHRFINGAVLALPRTSEVLEFLWKEASTTPPDTIEWGQLGPRLVTRAVQDHYLVDKAQRKEEFYPISYRDVWRLFDPREKKWVMKKIQHSSILHLWNETMRGTLAKTLRPPKGSFVSDQALQLGVDLPATQELPLEWVRTSWRKQLDPRPFEAGFLEHRAGRVLRLARRLRLTGQGKDSG